MPGGPLEFMRLIRVGILQRVAQLVVRVLPIAIRVPLRMGSSSHGGERKGQLGPGETVPMSGLPPEGYPEGSRRVWTPQQKAPFIIGTTPFVTPQDTLQVGAYSSVGSESAPHCYKSPFAHGFELSRRRKKRPVGTW